MRRLICPLLKALRCPTPLFSDRSGPKQPGDDRAKKAEEGAPAASVRMALDEKGRGYSLHAKHPLSFKKATLKGCEKFFVDVCSAP